MNGMKKKLKIAVEPPLDGKALDAALAKIEDGIKRVRRLLRKTKRL
jgi:hypothetical protein